MSSKTKPRASKPVRTQAAAPVPAAPFTTDDPRTAWKHFRAEALKADAASLAVCNADPDIVRTNVARGVASIAPLADKARKELPAVNVTRGFESTALALALTHAIDLVDTEGPATDPKPAADLDAGLSINERTSKMFADRLLLVTQLKVFTGLGDFSSKTLKTILEGQGPLDGARDVLTCDASLDGEKLAGRHPFTAAWREAATTRARRLLAELSPSDAAPEAAVRPAAAIERDAYWALLVAAHAELRKIGMVLLGEKDLDAKVPPLMRRAATRAAAEGGDAPK